MATQTKGYSAKVVITLLFGKRRLSVDQVGHSGLMVRDLDYAVPSGKATLVVSIDGKSKRLPIVLPHGIQRPNEFAKFF